ncbi:MAG TPA: 30S ribosomal protein S9 [Candidatus Saccharimonadia bacterium]|jgi:small subunit ribosomal protein S9|nr:30S ribosomal protein S9 [Candidatus Saccharimonadia bacterium]
MAESTQHYHYANGRRKEAIATARVYPGKGEIVVREQMASTYFNNDALMTVVEQPIKAAGQEQKLRVSLHVSGGGKRGQAEAARLAIARALNVMSEDLRPTLKKAGLLTRDPREKERMKPGLKKARKASQFSKR